MTEQIDDNVELAGRRRPDGRGAGGFAEPGVLFDHASVHQYAAAGGGACGRGGVTAVRIAAAAQTGYNTRGAWAAGWRASRLSSGIVLDFTRHMNRLLAVNIPRATQKEESPRAFCGARPRAGHRGEAGCVFQVLNDGLAGRAGSFAAGGNRHWGDDQQRHRPLHALRPGDHVDLDAVLADGELVRTRRPGPPPTCPACCCRKSSLRAACWWWAEAGSTFSGPRPTATGRLPPSIVDAAVAPRPLLALGGTRRS